MAKIDWQTLAQHSNTQTQKERAQNYGRFEVKKQWPKTDLIWPFGKHKGKLVEDIPTNYLCWFTEQAEKSGKMTGAYHWATQELKNRYYSSHKVSGPDSNTAVEKVSERNTRNTMSDSSQNWSIRQRSTNDEVPWD